MKLLSVCVPCYNSAAYMRHCVETLVAGGEEVEVIVVNDGSNKDNTLEVAKELESENPSIVKVVDKPNGGHGSAVNAGIKNATGKYYKVVDSDDWVDDEAFKKVLETLRSFADDENQIDLLLTDFMYDKQGATNKKIMSYEKRIPVRNLCSWNDFGSFPMGMYILMHSIIYRTEVLRECKLELPEHTFYVDNIFAFNPFPYCKKVYYLPVCFYHYFIGRDDQSVNEKVMIKRIDQQLKVNRLMAEEFKKDEEILSDKPKLENYMFKYLEIITVISSIMCYLSKDKENYDKERNLWKHLKTVDLKTYKKMNFSIYGLVFNHNNWFTRRLAIMIYRFAQKKYGFN